MTSISNGILNKEPPRAEPHAWWCERSENESRKKTASFSSYSIFVDAKSLLKSLERSHTEQQHDDFYSLVAKTEEDALKKYLSIRM